MEHGSAPHVTSAHCDRCGGERNCPVQATHTKHDVDDPHFGVPVEWWTTYDVLECCGCGEITVRRKLRCSEWDSFEHDPEAGMETLFRGEEVTYYPPATFRREPSWHKQITDPVLIDVLKELYTALHAGCAILAASGARTLLDRAMFLKVGDVGGFKAKLAAMRAQGFTGEMDHGLLEALTEVGHAASHRGYTPPIANLETVVDIIENLIQRLFILNTEAASVQAKTPTRMASRVH